MRPLPIALTLALAGAVAAPASAQMLPVRDQNPLTRPAYLPLPAALEAAADGRWGFAAGVQWSNTVNLGDTPPEQMVVDEETVEADLSLSRGVGDWQLRATLPVINRGAGVLDSFIDDWHRFFHLPRGDRANRPKNVYEVSYQRAGLAAVDAPSGTALGDLALEAGRPLAAAADGRLEGWLGVELPTGSRAHFTGNGALDAAAWLAGETRLSRVWTLAGRAGLSYLGGDAAAGQPYQRGLGFATLAFAWSASERLAALLQFDYHSPIARDSDLKFLGRAVQMTIGGRYRLESGAVFEAGVVEDVEVNHSPDITFHFGMRWPAGRPGP
ncbi:MAG TPA: DUF3187 family protein [Steroidobacteraceae bacterium]|nr:DUF3187 family protein [Steroidobacteraceae bacterium]